MVGFCIIARFHKCILWDLVVKELLLGSWEGWQSWIVVDFGKLCGRGTIEFESLTRIGRCCGRRGGMWWKRIPCL